MSYYKGITWDEEDLIQTKNACLQIASKYGLKMATSIGKRGGFGNLDFWSALEEAGYEF